MTSSLRTKAWIALTIASLGLSGCGGKHHDKTPKQVEEKDIKIGEAINLKANVNDALVFFIAQQPSNAKVSYEWIVIDTKNVSMQFYGQGTNEITITRMTEESVNTGNIKISCIAKLGEKELKKVPEQLFTIDQDAIKREKDILGENWSVNERMAMLYAGRAVTSDKDDPMSIQRTISQDWIIAHLFDIKHTTNSPTEQFIEGRTLSITDAMCSVNAKHKDYVEFMRKVNEEHKNNKIGFEKRIKFWTELTNIKQ